MDWLLATKPLIIWEGDEEHIPGVQEENMLEEITEIRAGNPKYQTKRKKLASKYVEGPCCKGVSATLDMDARRTDDDGVGQA